MPDPNELPPTPVAGRTATQRRAAAPLETKTDLATRYLVAPFFVVRSPLYPLEQLRAWNAEPATPATNALTTDERWSSRSALLSERLRVAFSQPELREATFFASSEVERLVAELPAEGELPSKLRKTLTRYFLRASGRETPFGLFAGVSLGQIASADCFELAESGKHRRKTSLSAGFLNQLLHEFAAREDVRDNVKREPSSTLSFVHGNYRFATDEARALNVTSHGNSLVELRFTPELARAVDLARQGATPNELAQALAHGELTREATLEFARVLCERRFLVPAWLPTATGPDPLAAALTSLAQQPPLAEETASLSAVQRQLGDGDQNALGDSCHAFRNTAETLRQLSKSHVGSHVLQTQLVKAAPALAMSERVAQQFLAAADVIQRVGRREIDPELSTFKRRFEARFQARWVPLTEALDSDVGIGFGQFDGPEPDPFLAEVPIARASAGASTFDAFDRARHEILTRALTEQRTILELDDSLLDAFPQTSEPGLPESFAVMARLGRGSNGQLSVIMPLVVAPSAANLLARFCHADAQLAGALKQYVTAEQALAGDTILADVAYFPNDLTANIVVRPTLREYEIPYFGKSGAPPERQIPISDLYVGVEGGEVALYSARLQKRVRVRIANALDSSNQSHPTVYRFLGALQAQPASALASQWSWGALQDSAFLPRVVYRGIVLSVATWRLSRAELAPILQATGARAFALLQVLRQQRALPRWLSRTEGDQRLPVDLDNELSVEELLHEASKRSQLVLEELLPGPDELVLNGPEGAFCGEFLVPFLRRPALADTPLQPQARPSCDVATAGRYAPGSNWLYAKIYTPRSHTDAVLARIRSGLVEPLLGSATNLWFYVPYADPESHLRVRFKGSPSRLRDQVLPALQRALQPLLMNGVVWRLQLDTYEQERERYGGERGMELAESIFGADSEATCQLIEVCGHDAESRWQLALLGMNGLLCDAGLGLAQRAAFAQAASDSYAAEVGANAATRRAIGMKYRHHAPQLARLLAQPPTRVREILEQRSARTLPLWAEVELASSAGTLAVSKADLVRSFVHMHVIRLLGVRARSYELLLYSFLRRLYALQSVRSGESGASQS